VTLQEHTHSGSVGNVLHVENDAILHFPPETTLTLHKAFELSRTWRISVTHLPESPLFAPHPAAQSHQKLAPKRCPEEPSPRQSTELHQGMTIDEVLLLDRTQIPSWIGMGALCNRLPQCIHLKSHEMPAAPTSLPYHPTSQKNGRLGGFGS